ncbi:hypothetical protein ACOMHN_064647 [Nucella lapillus]
MTITSPRENMSKWVGTVHGRRDCNLSDTVITNDTTVDGKSKALALTQRTETTNGRRKSCHRSTPPSGSWLAEAEKPPPEARG